MPRIAGLLRRSLGRVRPYVPSFARSQGLRFPCPYCGHLLKTESGRSKHIAKSPTCSRAEQSATTRTDAALAITTEEAEVEADLETDREAEVESFADTSTTSGWQAPNSGSSSTSSRRSEAGEVPRALTECEGSHTTTNEPYQPPDSANGEEPMRWDEKEGGFVERFPDLRAGAPINNRVARVPDMDVYLAAAGNLADPFHFATAELLMTTGLTGMARDEHLKSHMYVGRTPWASNAALMADIDRLPHGPEWKIYEMDVSVPGNPNQQSYLFTRNIVEVICDIMAESSFCGDMEYTPKRVWQDETCTTRIYGNSWSGDWWWRMQLRIPNKSATIVGIIIASDRTKLSQMSGGQSAYPVYVSVINLAKSVRREASRKGMALLAYLPVDSFSLIANKDKRAQLKNNLTHRAMEKVVEPLHEASRNGVEMLCADGRFRHGYPIIAGTTLDWQEQCVMGCIVGSACPKCMQKRAGRGNNTVRAPLRTARDTLEALSRYFKDGDLGELEESKIQPWWPWWANLPYTDFYASLMPDVLHQIHQGMVKSHCVQWLRKKMGKRAFDLHFMAMPEAEGMRHFDKGISKLSGQWTGRESREIARQLLPVAAGQELAVIDPDLTRVIRAVLEFSYRAHASRMTDKDIDRLQAALDEFHQFKQVLVNDKNLFAGKEARFDLIAKLHWLLHFPHDIREMGTPDGFSTEAPEHMHIESAKVPWRASNKVRPEKQMVKFIQRFEAIRIHKAYLRRYLGPGALLNSRRRKKSRVVYDEDEEGVEVGGRSMGVVDSGKEAGDDGDEADWQEEQDERAEGEQMHIGGGPERAPAGRAGHVIYPNPTLSLALRPTAPRVRGLDIIARYGAIDFIRALHVYLKKHGTRPDFPAAFLPTTHHKYNLWHRLYLYHQPLPFDPENPKRDVVRARPQGPILRRAFDVALFLYRPDDFGLHRYRAGRVRAIFSLPDGFQQLCPHPLVYVELFTPFSDSVSPFHGMNTTSHALTPEGKRRAAVISIYDVIAACHLAPNFRRLDKAIQLRSNLDLLSICRYFFFNHFYNHFIFQLVEHWRSTRIAAQQNPRAW